MVFSSVSFLVFFLPCLLVLYFMVPRRYRGARNFILLAFSLAFYACGGPKFLLLMLLSIVINYCCGLLAGAKHRPAVRKAGVTLAAVLGLGLLGWFKYAGFFGEMLHALMPFIPVPQVTLPIGISFFTFQGLSYVIDVFRDAAAVQKNPLKLALYISFFPQLVAGPIVRYTTVADEIDERHESVSEFSAGSVRFLFGLAKKMLLANAVAQIADAAFSAVSPSVALAWLGAVAYTFQIYFDFSAYSDMAIGLGRMFGFHFLENFNYPYVSRSVTEFWRRWHISLSTWFRDYVYIPLGGNRCSRARNILNLFLVWALTGLWHGANWTFIAWGLWFFVLLIGEKFLWGKALSRLPSLLQHVYAMLLVILSWVLFRADDIGAALCYMAAMFGRAPALCDGRAVYYALEFWPELLLCCIAALPVKNLLETALEKRNSKLSRGILIVGPKLASLALLALSYCRLVSGQVFDDLETLFCDYAAWRTPALKAVTWADLNVFRRPVVNETVVTDDVLLPQLYDPAMSDDDIRAQAKLVAEDNAALQKQVESYGGHYCYVAVPCQYVYYEDSYPAYLTNRSRYTDLELSALTEEMNAQGVCFLDMGPVFDSLGHPPEFSSRVDNHYGLLGAYETYRAAVQKLNGDYGLALSFPEEGTDVTFSALPNPYMGSRTRKLLGLRGDDEKLLTAAFREDIPFTRLDNWQEVASAVYTLPATEDEALTYGLYMGGDIAETCIRTDRSSLPTALIFGDSFTNAVESLAYYSFDEMRSVDLRHYKTQSISDYIAAYQPDVVICIRDYEALLSRSDNGGLS